MNQECLILPSELPDDVTPDQARVVYRHVEALWRKSTNQLDGLGPVGALSSLVCSMAREIEQMKKNALPADDGL